MKRKSKILIGSAIVFVALLVALFLARKQLVGGPGSPTVEGSRAVTDGGIKISRLERTSRCCGREGGHDPRCGSAC
jgi:hypothetical protein